MRTWELPDAFDYNLINSLNPGAQVLSVWCTPTFFT